MNAQTELAGVLRGIAETCVLQEEPYPVAAPASVSEAVDMIRAARDHSFRVMILGSGSSFPADFALHRSNVMALLSVKLTGAEQVSPFSVRVLCGTPLTALFRAGVSLPRKTFGGLLCSLYRGSEGYALRRLWPRIRHLQVLTGTGDLQELAGPSEFDSNDSGMANVLLGSRGRLCMVTAAELQCPLPIDEGEQFGSSSGALMSGPGEAAISRADVQTLFDPSGLFQW